MANPEKGYLIYNEGQNAVKLDLSQQKATFKVSYINPKITDMPIERLRLPKAHRG